MFFSFPDSKERDLIGWIKSHLAERNEEITAENFLFLRTPASRTRLILRFYASSVHFSITNLDLFLTCPLQTNSKPTFPFDDRKMHENTKNNNQKTKRNVIIYETIYFRAIFMKHKSKN